MATMDTNVMYEYDRSGDRVRNVLCEYDRFDDRVQLRRQGSSTVRSTVDMAVGWSLPLCERSGWF